MMALSGRLSGRKHHFAKAFWNAGRHYRVQVRMATNDAKRAQDIAKLRDMIQDIRIAMLTTIDAEGRLSSRPMAVQHAPFEGELWFFTNEHSAKVGEVIADPQANVVLSDPSHDRFISISGTAQLIQDHALLASMWDPKLERWFAKGLADPELALLRVTVDSAEYWDAPPSVAVDAWSHVRAAFGGKPYADQSHGRVELT